MKALLIYPESLETFWTLRHAIDLLEIMPQAGLLVLPGPPAPASPPKQLSLGITLATSGRHFRILKYQFCAKV